MRLSKLEMQGFKSFAKKTELLISDGVTAVVGPNGSGKSNISDAIRWVLGEQSARALRGNKMEDVIFNGTAIKHPLSMCSVSLTFENSDHYLPINNEEVTVTRRAFRSGEGEYAINGKDCRLKDILDLFRDTGIGKDGYSIISQGRVDEILSNRSQDRREALEEAAGVTRYRVRREESIRKLSLAKKNIERLEDILSELSQRIIPLQKESAKAKESLALQNDLKVFEINHFIKETEKISDKLATQQKALEDFIAASDENSEEDLLLQSTINKQETELSSYETEMNSTREEQISLLSRYDLLQSSIRVENEHMLSAESESMRLHNDLNEISEQIERLNNILNSPEEIRQETISVFNDALIEAEKAYSAVCASVEKAERELEDKKTAMMNNMNRLSQSRNNKTRLETMLQAVTDRVLSIEDESQAESHKKDLLSKELEDANSDFNSQNSSAADINAAILNLEVSQKDIDAQKAEILAQYQENEKKLLSAQSNLSVLKELARKREGFQNSVKLLMRDASVKPQLSRAILGLLAEMISVPQEYETAIGTALGASLQFIVSPTGEDAKAIIEYVREKQYGRVTVLPLDILRVYDNDSGLNAFLSIPGVIGVASSLVKCSATCSKAVDYLLGRTLIVRDISCALKLRRENKCYMQIVTLEGDMLQSGGTISGGSKIKRNFDIISREREISELKRTIRVLLSEKEKISERVLRIDEKRAAIVSMIDHHNSDLHRLQIELERSKDKIEIINRDVSAAEIRIQKLQEEYDSNQESLLQIKEQLQQLDEEANIIEHNDADDKLEIIARQKQLSVIKAERDKKLNAYTDAKIRLAAAQKDLLAKTREREKLVSEIDASNKKAQSLQKMIATVRGNYAAASSEKKRLEIDADQISSCIEEVNNKIDTLQETIGQAKEDITKNRRRRDELLNESRDVLEKKSRVEMLIGKLKTQQEQLADLIWQNYEITYENALSYKAESPIPALPEKISTIKKKLKEIGTINPGSIQEYAEVSARYTELSLQLQDVKTASDDLENLISNLTKTMQRAFIDGFSRIKQEFNGVFTDLFGGGVAELKLTDPTDVLNSDIEIIAQPPGKKLLLLSLMSGGERALTAIALLFAMLRIKSPSFCVLDEIETSLDEENVNRFASFLKQYSEHTQFIIITHRKGSMEAASSIYGVSMEEKGISTIVSAKWEEAS